MAAKCPHCGEPLRWYNLRAECKHCGVNIPNYNWENRLEEDAEKAETAFAKLHYKLGNFKSATVGSVFRIIRLVFTLLPLVALVVPLINIKLSFPFYEKSGSVSFLTLILNYITKLDFAGGFKLMSATALGPSVKFLMIAIVLAFAAVAAGVLNFFVTLIAAVNLKAGFNVVLNVIAAVCWTASAATLSVFAANALQNTVNVFEGKVVLWGYAVGIALFTVNVIINIITSKSFKKQLASQPTLEEAVEKELAEIRAEA
ncbi:MAG: prepilin peptidase [Ruminococcaceae bacterium]|nr:prepilin peptidase [Oscillospiraceae bacterium]